MIKKLLIAVCLCGMILPVFAKHKVAPRKRGQMGSCSSNLSQCGKYIQLYLNDYQNMPRDCNPVGSSLKSGVPFILQKLYGSYKKLPKGTNWDANQNRMIMTDTPWICPDMSDNPGAPGNSMYNVSYVRATMAFVEMVNQSLTEYKYPKYNGFPRYYVNRCKKPARLLFFADKNNTYDAALYDDSRFVYGEKQCAVSFRHPVFNCNTLMGDGHVEAYNRSGDRDQYFYNPWNKKHYENFPDYKPE